MTISQQTQPQGAVASFLAELNELRWDDHRYYHQSRINQSLHFLSSISFMTAYIMLFINPGVAALIGWGIGMVSRQSGHFFFEPRDYDHINKATHEHKEEIKVGYNLNRKRVLHAIWAAIPDFDKGSADIAADDFQARGYSWCYWLCNFRFERSLLCHLYFRFRNCRR